MPKSRHDDYDEDVKSGPSSMKEQAHDEEMQDYEIQTKKDAPPRFSTIFETKSAPVPVEHYIEAPRRRERGGIFLTWPIVILLIIIFLFETIIIFAYTSIGLYNQLSGLPNRSTAFMSHTATTACDLAPQNQPAVAPINISPNIIIGAPDHAEPLVQTVTLMGHLPLPQLLTSTTSSSSSTSSSVISSSSTTTSSSAGPVVTVTPGGIATSVAFVTASIESKSQAPPSTITTVVIAGQSTTSTSTSSSTSDTTKTTASTSTSTSTSTTSSSSSTSTISSTSTSTTSSSTTTSSTTASTSTTEEARGTNAAFIGGLGGPGGH